MNEPTIKPDRAPVPSATSFFSYSPLHLDVADRVAPMEVRVTAPVSGDQLPILLLSHGHGASNFLASVRGYAPLVEFYAAHGFAVMQVTHLDSKTLARDSAEGGAPLFLRSRAMDMRWLIDRMDEIQQRVPFLNGRLDTSRIGAIGHSLGGYTVAMLLGQRMTDADTHEVIDLTDTRIKAGVLLGAPGNGKDGAAWVRENYPELLRNDFSAMKTPALVVAGDKDFNESFSERRNWRADAYHLSPGPNRLLRNTSHRRQS